MTYLSRYAASVLMRSLIWQIKILFCQNHQITVAKMDQTVIKFLSDLGDNQETIIPDSRWRTNGKDALLKKSIDLGYIVDTTPRHLKATATYYETYRITPKGRMILLKNRRIN